MCEESLSILVPREEEIILFYSWEMRRNDFDSEKKECRERTLRRSVDRCVITTDDYVRPHYLPCRACSLVAGLRLSSFQSTTVNSSNCELNDRMAMLRKSQEIAPLPLFPQHDHGGVLVTILLHDFRNCHLEIFLGHMDSSLS
jgi:hypothetical protein